MWQKLETNPIHGNTWQRSHKATKANRKDANIEDLWKYKYPYKLSNQHGLRLDIEVDQCEKDHDHQGCRNKKLDETEIDLRKTLIMARSALFVINA